MQSNSEQSIDNAQLLLAEGQTSLMELNDQVQTLAEDASEARQVCLVHGHKLNPLHLFTEIEVC